MFSMVNIIFLMSAQKQLVSSRQNCPIQFGAVIPLKKVLLES